MLILGGGVYSTRFVRFSEQTATVSL